METDMNKQNKHRPVQENQKFKLLSFLKHNPLYAVVGTVLLVIAIVGVAVTLAQSSLITVLGGDTLALNCDGRGIQIQRNSRADLTITCQPGTGNGNPTATPIVNPTNEATVIPTGEPTVAPTVAPTQEPTPQPTAPPPPGGVIEPYADAPSCESLGVPHDNVTWHGIWDETYGCHWNHEHHDNPHDGDTLFGTEYYAWANGELSYPWQTFAGADSLYTLNNGNADPTTWTWPAPPSDPNKFENGAKHNVYFWRVDLGEEGCTSGDYALAENCLESFRLQGHGSGNHIGAVTTFHSMYIQGLAQTMGNACDNSQGAYLPDGSLNPNACFGSVGGWIDFGRLRMKGMDQNDPASRLYLPGDNPAYESLPIEVRPYRSHPCTGSNCTPGDIDPTVLHSWNSSGNYLVPDFGIGPRIYYGYGFHIDDGWGPVDTNAADLKAATGMDVLACGMDFADCEFNSSSMGVFRAYIAVPDELDGTAYDQDGQVNGFVTMRGFATRYGDIVSYTEASGNMVGNCTAPGLDCVPFVFSHFPVQEAGYRGNIIQHTPEPGVRDSDMTEYDVYFCSDGGACDPDTADGRSNPVPSGWIEFPN